MKSADASLDVVYGFWYRQAWHIGAYYEPRGAAAQVVIDDEERRPQRRTENEEPRTKNEEPELFFTV